MISSRRAVTAKFKQLNTDFIGRVVAGIATIECIYLFTAWSLLPLLWPDSQAFIFYVSGGILQLVLLPTILYWQDFLSKSTEAQRAADHAALMSVLADAEASRVIMTEMLADARDTRSDMAEVLRALHLYAAAPKKEN